MAKNKPLPPALLARLHGKGSMSEILSIERERLRQASEREMRERLAAREGETVTPPPPANQPTAQPTNPPTIEAAAAPAPFLAPLPEPATSAGPALALTPLPETAPQPTIPPVDPPAVPPANEPTWQPAEPRTSPPTHQPTNRPAVVDGFSPLSRVVGENFSEFGPIFLHSAASIEDLPELAPEVRAYYERHVEPQLPFSSQRALLRTLCQLTVGVGSPACQVTLELLSKASGIRNAKTLRKWLTDLHQRGHIRYTPVHGDPRGSIVLLTPPRTQSEQWMKQRTGHVSN